MMRFLLVLALISASGLAWMALEPLGELQARATAQTAPQVAQGAQEPKKGRNLLMQQKLGHAQKLLEGVAIQDFGLIEKHAEELIILSKKAEWQVLQTPEYALRSDEFRRNADGMAKAAKEKNLDGAALAYVQVTMSCVNCHKHVREVRITRHGWESEFRIAKSAANSTAHLP